jgi:hypothetical protein
MNPNLKLEIAFAPTDEVSSWIKPVRSLDSETSTATRLSDRFRAGQLNTARSISFGKFLLWNGGEAAPRGELVVRQRLSRRRLCLPNHTLERPAP